MCSLHVLKLPFDELTDVEKQREALIQQKIQEKQQEYQQKLGKLL